jgi:hypothetical protein
MSVLIGCIPGHEATYNMPRLRTKMTVILACLVILTFQSMGMGSKAWWHCISTSS